MKSMEIIAITKLQLDLKNYRFTPQKNEIDEITSMISLNPDRFWALMESIIADGYLPGENIIVLENKSTYTVKEGNRRIAVLKIIHGLVETIEVPDYIAALIGKIKSTPKWIEENSKVPCTVFSQNEIDYVKKVVALIHATGEKAARDVWTSIARARYSRDEKGQPEPILDLLEVYLGNARNLDALTKEKWSGDYPLTVLKEAIQKLAPVFPNQKLEEITKLYPRRQKTNFESLLSDIGNGILTFQGIRSSSIYFGNKYGFKKPLESSAADNGVVSPPSSGHPNGNTTTDGLLNTEPQMGRPAKGKVSYPSNDPRSVKAQLRQFHPAGLNREKVLVILDEIRKLKVDEYPIAFCFLLRSMFEISSKIYCQEHAGVNGPKYLDKNNKELPLLDILNSIVKHVTNGGNTKEMQKYLHGAITELARPDGILSVTSMNQLIHNPKFIISSTDICILFHNVFPLLDVMNRGI